MHNSGHITISVLEVDTSARDKDTSSRAPLSFGAYLFDVDACQVRVIALPSCVLVHHRLLSSGVTWCGRSAVHFACIVIACVWLYTFCATQTIIRRVPYSQASVPLLNPFVDLEPVTLPPPCAELEAARVIARRTLCTVPHCTAALNDLCKQRPDSMPQWITALVQAVRLVFLSHLRCGVKCWAGRAKRKNTRPQRQLA